MSVLSSTEPVWHTDPLLRPWLAEIKRRYAHCQGVLDGIVAKEGSLGAFVFANGLRHLGLQRADCGTWFREWAPGALAVSLVGDFNGWNAATQPCHLTERGVWAVYLPDGADGRPVLPAGARYKVALTLGADRHELRVPAWAQATEQDTASGEFCAVVPAAELLAFRWRRARPARPVSLRVYEAHVGISSSEPVVASWASFRRDVLPRVARSGCTALRLRTCLITAAWPAESNRNFAPHRYTALLLMAVAEHGLYASFGYQVTSFFAPSSRFGPPHELQALVDEAHGLGLLVLFELVRHSARAAGARGSTA